MTEQPLGRAVQTPGTGDEAAQWTQLDMQSLIFLGEEHLDDYQAGELPPPGTSTSSLVVDVEPAVLDELVREAAASGRTVAQVAQARLRQSAA